MSINTVAVLGAGTMGAGIAETVALAGLSVVCIEQLHEQQERAQQRIAGSVEKGINRGKVTASSPAEVLDRICWKASLDAAAAADFVIEAVSENETLKIDIFKRLGELCRPDVILASNTSSISITRLGTVSGRAGQVVGMHFFNPVPIMKPVEVVRGVETTDATVAATESLSQRLGKTPVLVNDAPGFVVNRVLMPMINEAIFALESGVADARSIDQIMKLGCNQPMGPLELGDLIGLDVCLAIMEVLHTQLGDPKFRPCPMLRRMVDAGRLGRKTGRGFYEYG